MNRLFYNSTIKTGFWQMMLVTLLAFLLPAQGVMAQVAAPANPEPATPVQMGTTAYGARFMVVTGHPEATRAGYEVLRWGGSAADAAVAVQLVLGLVEPQSSGLGGGGFALYYDAATKQVHSFDGRETAPMSAGKYLFIGDDGKPMDFYDAAVGGRAVGVPGTLRLLETLHKRFGVKPWNELFGPAITLAEGGFTVTPRLAAMVENDTENLKSFSATNLYFFPDVSTPIRAGQRLVNPSYGTTLRKVAGGGADAFYKGDIAQSIAKAVQEDIYNPGLLTIEDMANYKVIERLTVCSTYRGYLICTVGEPSSGGLSLLAALGILEHFDLASLGQFNPQSWHLIAEASRLAFEDRNYYMADPHYVSSPGVRLIDKNYLVQRAALINPAQANPKIGPGVPPGWNVKKTSSEPPAVKPPGTSHFCIVDAKGNMVSMTDSVEDSFGSRMFVHGFLLNNQLTDFSFTPEVNGRAVANRVEGGKRPRSTMTPVIMFTPGGDPYLIIGSAGGSAIMGYVLERIVSMVDWKGNIVSALAMPNIVNRGNGLEIEESGDGYKDALANYGHPVKLTTLNSGLTAIAFDRGLMTGAADPRREGTAMGQ